MLFDPFPPAFTELIHHRLQVTPGLLVDRWDARLAAGPQWPPRLERRLGGAAEHREQPRVRMGAARLLAALRQVEVVIPSRSEPFHTQEPNFILRLLKPTWFYGSTWILRGSTSF